MLTIIGDAMKELLLAAIVVLVIAFCSGALVPALDQHIALAEARVAKIVDIEMWR